MKHWKVISVLVLIFLLGVGTGILLSIRAAKKKAQELQHPEEVVAKAMKRMTWGLDLTPEQAQKIEPIIVETVADFKKVQIETWMEVGSIYDNAETRISAHLTPEQKKLVEKARAKRLKKFKDWHGIEEKSSKSL
jgi:Spy/CpxP family protein refolding chaperone